ncbi:hypothetical protein EQG63_07040 [Flavobacterium amnicola]|uniref:WG repeat-containing protein n=1 Tax=Flavobacterium amnicola TaxID=2506422 RepID=A0A4Q1K310_9FLAO|nr:hypothetical protein [Flavobacterium amnicola]RXR19194.1 hypothetical protein EQG63_07040 [Flavobacterium amnicola]
MSKKITLLVASIFLAGGMAYASENPVFSEGNKEKRIRLVDYRDAEPIVFNERGIDFYVFPTGEFDFNTRPDDSHGDYYFKTAGKRGTVVVERGGRPENFGVRIERDAFGRVRRVGNTFINYDAFDRVNRIGTVYMRYNSFALTQIGGMRIIYDRKGRIVDMFGNVKRTYHTGYTHDYDYPRNNYDSYDNGDSYYYKQDGTKAKVETLEDKKEDKRDDDSRR